MLSRRIQGSGDTQLAIAAKGKKARTVAIAVLCWLTLFWYVIGLAAILVTRGAIIKHPIGGDMVVPPLAVWLYRVGEVISIVGLWRMRKWAAYAYLFLLTVGLTVGVMRALSDRSLWMDVNGGLAAGFLGLLISVLCGWAVASSYRHMV